MNKHLHALISLVLFWILVMCGCTDRWLFQSHSDVTRDKHFVIVTVQGQDTLPGLARTYLGDPGKAPWIAEYNHVQTLRTGMRLVIPLKPVIPGGLRSDGYQIVPVLLYPKIIANGDRPRSLSARRFENQLQYLRANGYSTISLDRMAAFLNLDDQLPSRAFVITFDSAEQWVYELAYPLLKRYGFTAAVFIPIAQIGKPGRMTWDELAEMASHGFDIGTSGLTGRKLTSVPPGMDTESYLGDLDKQIGAPQKAFARHLKMKCRYFAYPDGKTDDMIIALLKKHGYRVAFTHQRGSNPFFVDDYKVHRCLIAAEGNARKLRQNLTTFVSAELR
jgi:peptidoglycan/xylan/chitin deacetylase (PgdA/CDA1 family)